MRLRALSLDQEDLPSLLHSVKTNHTPIHQITITLPPTRRLVDAARARLDPNEPLCPAAHELIIRCPAELNVEAVPARFVAHFIASFVHPRRIRVEFAAQGSPVSTAYAAQVVKDLKAICRSVEEVEVGSVRFRSQ